jgi:zinc/manganese transport system substrate-binding protein
VSRAPVQAALSALALLALTACGGDGTAPDSSAAVESGDPAACPGEVVDVVASVAPWGSIARQLGGDCANVTTIVASAGVDPHDVVPGTADLAAFDRADLAVINGGRYDDWARGRASDAPALVEATELARAGSEDGPADDAGEDDPHVWYDPAAVGQVADAITRELTELSPDAGPYFDAQRAAFAAELQPLLDTVATLRSATGGRTYAATEAVFDRMAAAVGLTDVTPAGYRRSAGGSGDPAPEDLAGFEAALRDGEVDVLVVNSQTGGGAPEQLRDAAEDTDVPVVEVTEASPDGDGSFVEWQLAQLQELSDALGLSP